MTHKKPYTKPRDFMKLVGFSSQAVPTFIYQVTVTDADGKDVNLSETREAVGYTGDVTKSFRQIDPDEGEEDRIVHEVFFPMLRDPDPRAEEDT